MPDNLFDILTAGEQTCTRPEPTQSPTKKNHRRKTLCLELSDHYLYRRAFSECSLLDACGSFDFAPGHSYHFITAGDVDALSYLKAILRQQPLDYCLFSTWCMAAEDILQFDQWLQEGKIRRLDAYVGEIFPNSYKVEYALLKECFARNTGGGENCRFPQSFQNFRRIRPAFRLRDRNLGKHQHQPENRKRVHHNRTRNIRILSLVFRRYKIIRT